MKTLWIVLAVLFLSLPTHSQTAPPDTSKPKHLHLERLVPTLDAPNSKREILGHLALTGASETFSMLDAHSTRVGIQYPGVHETDPLFRPFVRSNGLYAVQSAEISAVGWLGWKLHHSRYILVRALWWAPQTVQIGANISGWRTNERLIVKTQGQILTKR